MARSLTDAAYRLTLLGMSNLPRAALFLNGRYDLSARAYYERSARQANTFCVFADGGAKTLQWLNTAPNAALIVGDFDSFNPSALNNGSAAQIERRWEGQTDKDLTDGQLALHAALERQTRQIDIHGAFPRQDAFDHDHFLGNLLLLYEAHDRGAEARLSEPKEALYLCVETLALRREGDRLNRVSFLPFAGGARVRRTEGLRWPLLNFNLSNRRANALRNEFLPDADHIRVQLDERSPPVYVAHNWS